MEAQHILSIVSEIHRCATEVAFHLEDVRRLPHSKKRQLREKLARLHADPLSYLQRKVKRIISTTAVLGEDDILFEHESAPDVLAAYANDLEILRRALPIVFGTDTPGTIEFVNSMAALADRARAAGAFLEEPAEPEGKFEFDAQTKAQWDVELPVWISVCDMLTETSTRLFRFCQRNARSVSKTRIRGRLWRLVTKWNHDVNTNEWNDAAFDYIGAATLFGEWIREQGDTKGALLAFIEELASDTRQLAEDLSSGKESVVREALDMYACIDVMPNDMAVERIRLILALIRRFIPEEKRNAEYDEILGLLKLCRSTIRQDDRYETPPMTEV